MSRRARRRAGPLPLEVLTPPPSAPDDAAPLPAGAIELPPRDEIFYLSQRPYMVSGSLRDQLLYPQPPGHVAAQAPGAAAAAGAKGRADPEALRRCLDRCEVGYLQDRFGWDAILNWEDTLSGGEKQRLAMARLLCHRPKYAVLDECTSAVSADGEMHLYNQLVRDGITFLSVAHRPGVKDFHQVIVEFSGTQKGAGWTFTKRP